MRPGSAPISAADSRIISIRSATLNSGSLLSLLSTATMIFSNATKPL